MILVISTITSEIKTRKGNNWMKQDMHFAYKRKEYVRSHNASDLPFILLSPQRHHLHAVATHRQQCRLLHSPPPHQI
jgi:hypothetical protein